MQEDTTGLCCAYCRDCHQVHAALCVASNASWALFETYASPRGEGQHAKVYLESDVTFLLCVTCHGLLLLGATIVGKTHMSELAYSLDGNNAHYGTPLNPAAPGRNTGGSSSGSAVSVNTADAVCYNSSCSTANRHAPCSAGGHVDAPLKPAAISCSLCSESAHFAAALGCC